MDVAGHFATMKHTHIAASRTDNDARLDAPVYADRAQGTAALRSGECCVQCTIPLLTFSQGLIESLIDGPDHRKNVQLSEPGLVLTASGHEVVS